MHYDKTMFLVRFLTLSIVTPSVPEARRNVPCIAGSQMAGYRTFRHYGTFRRHTFRFDGSISNPTVLRSLHLPMNCFCGRAWTSNIGINLASLKWHIRGRRGIAFTSNKLDHGVRVYKWMRQTSIACHDTLRGRASQEKTTPCMGRIPYVYICMHQR